MMHLALKCLIHHTKYGFLIPYEGASVSEKTVRIPYLLRKSRGGHDAPVLKREDFPVRFHHAGRTYQVNITKAGKVIMTAE